MDIDILIYFILIYYYELGFLVTLQFYYISTSFHYIISQNVSWFKVASSCYLSMRWFIITYKKLFKTSTVRQVFTFYFIVIGTIDTCVVGYCYLRVWLSVIIVHRTKIKILPSNASTLPEFASIIISIIAD